MAVNVSGEMQQKQIIRANNNGGSNPWWSNPGVVDLVNAISGTTNAKLYRLSVVGAGTFTISGAASGYVVSGTSAATTSGTVGAFVTALQSGVGNNVYVQVWAKSTDYLKNTTTDFILKAASGVTLPTLSGIAGTATLTLTQLTGALSDYYPNYYGAPYVVPSWVDDATVHAYDVNGVGAVVQDTSKVVQKQVRQIQTSYSETQILDGYFAAYSGSLNQTAQKNTKQQQC